MKPTLLSRLIWALLLMLVSMQPAVSVEQSAIKVFVSIEPLRYLAEKVGGDYVDVEVMIAPGENPATFSPTPRKMARLTTSRLFFYVGVPSEKAWLPRVSENYPATRLVDVRTGISLRKQAPHGEAHDHAHEEDLDPHIWNDPIMSIRIAANMRDALSKLDPTHRDIYEENFRRLANKLHALDRKIAAMLKDLPSRRFMVFHPSWGYFADRYGLQQIAIEKSGKSPGIRHLGELIRQARTANIKTIIVQPQFSRRDAEAIAREIGGNVAAVDPLAYNIPETLLLMAKTLASSKAGMKP